MLNTKQMVKHPVKKQIKCKDLDFLKPKCQARFLSEIKSPQGCPKAITWPDGRSVDQPSISIEVCLKKSSKMLKRVLLAGK